MTRTHKTLIRSALLGALLSAGFAASPAHAKVVGDAKLEQYCAEEAMVRLNVDRGKITTLPTELSKGKFYVNGEAMTGSGLVTFECRFSKQKMLQGFKSNGGGDDGGQAAAPAKSKNGIPQAALEKCLYTFGAPAKVKQFSPLKPGYSEIIIRAKNGSRQVACTVPDDGKVIEDWVEMKP